MRRLPPLKALYAFEAAARHESVTRAATELNVSHSAISQQIKILEQYFNQKLFEKKGNGVTLTPKARTFLKDVTESLDQIAVASENLSVSHVVNRISVNATPTFSVQWLVPRIAEFQRQYPRIEVRTETSTTDLLSKEYDASDIIIRRFPMKRTGMECTRILDDITVAVASPELIERDPVTEPADLLRFKLLHIKSRISAWPNWFRKAGIETSQTLSGQIFDHIFLGLASARSGAGICLCPRVLVEDELASGRLVALFPEHQVSGSGFYALYDTKNRNLRNVERLISWLKDTSDDEAQAPKQDVEWELYS
ncbi:DNA-binding transcriptional activator GcvA [Salipiger pallidus]|uniref:DNA-binding transcriptional activator GcvA n=1 Tax=Salipiger pallidus TaxID=1775170 RepID=A0A8J2ZK46_9RHOB|nr:LysR substrate-binding domain-containing protein [Salipiger pallidus]GGG72581.1 DNA-binding transcriptional activator GcvA [Salipiger pallidus]